MAKSVSIGKVAPVRARRKPLPPPAPITDLETLAQAFEILRQSDGDLIDRLVAECGPPPLRLRDGGLKGLAWIVVSQQVSTASASAIHGRLDKRFPNLHADILLAADDETLRQCGLSAPKMKTLRAIASAAREGAVDFDSLARSPAEEAHAALTAIHGVGPWTADIYLLFCLGHPDAWPAGDLALQEAARMALGLKTRPDAKKLAKIAERWRPARGVAARVLWAWYGVKKAGGGMPAL